MKTRWILAAMGAAGLGAAGAATAALARARAQQAARDFYDWHGSTEAWPTVDGIPTRSPAWVNHLELFGSFHAADLAAVTAELPSDDIHPVRLPDGRAVVAIVGLHYRDLTNAAFSGAIAPPYGEVIVAAMVSREAAPPVLPLVAGMLPMPIGIRAGMFPLFVPVTHRWSRDGGRAMGIPKFVADLDFEEQADARAVRVFEGGRFILRLQVPSRGRVRILRQPMLTYASLDGRLLEAETPVLAHGRMRLAGRGAELELGDHPVADRLRGLGISGEAIGTLNWVAGRLILPTATPVGAARPYEGYLGTDRWFGRYTVQYPGTAPIDQYGYLTREGIEGAIVRGGGDLIGDYETIDADLGRSPMAGDTGTRPAEPVAVG